MLSSFITKFRLREIIAFGLVGGLATFTHYCGALLSNEWLQLPLYIANLIGYLCAVGVSFIGHSKVTFQVDMNHVLLRRFCLMSIATFGLSEVLLWSLESGLEMESRIVMLVVVVTIPAISYLLNKFWVYR